MAVVSVLEALAVALHVAEAQEEVFVGSSPCVVDTHGVVCGDWTVDEGVVLLGVVVAREVAVDDGLPVLVGDVPLFEPLLFGLDKVDFGFGEYGVECVGCLVHFDGLGVGVSRQLQS